MFHSCLGKVVSNLQVFENPPSCGNNQRCKTKKGATFGRRNGQQNVLVLNIFSSWCEQVGKMFLRQAWRRCVHCTPCAHPSENGSHTINPAKCYLPKAAFVAWRLFAESKHMPNVHVICSPNRRPSCVALTHCAKQCEQKQHTLPQRIH